MFTVVEKPKEKSMNYTVIDYYMEKHDFLPCDKQGVGVIFISSGMPVVFIALSAIGSTLCVSKENVVTVCKNRLALLSNINK